MTGMGYVINALTDNTLSVKAYEDSIGKEIIKAKISEDLSNAGITLSFNDGTSLIMEDTAQSCCEFRWMHTDDDVEDLVGGQFLGVEEVTNIEPSGYDENGYDEVQEEAFVKITSTAGSITVVSHNHHNGYYGGISLNFR